MSILDKKIGIVGGGQLGKMMVLEAKRLGFYVALLDPTSDCPASSICDLHIVADLKDNNAYNELAKHSDVITYEFEHINADALETIEKNGTPVYPSVTALKTIQNKYSQKMALKNAEIPIPRFAKVSTTDDVKEFAKLNAIGYPLMLKTTTDGYDGKGNALIQTENNVEEAFDLLGSGAKELMVEEFIEYTKEISIIACRGINGDKVTYPVAENTHANSILDVTKVPADITAETSQYAADIANKVMNVFEGVGTFCVEMFVTKNGEIYVNEVAPRPHNSGHYTIEGCFANQFENHIRAIVGLPFGDTSLIKPTVMVNLLGQSDGKATLVGIEEAYRNNPNVHIHLYGKKESKTDRKMGHYTIVGENVEKVLEQALKLKEIISVAGQ